MNKKLLALSSMILMVLTLIMVPGLGLLPPIPHEPLAPEIAVKIEGDWKHTAPAPPFTLPAGVDPWDWDYCYPIPDMEDPTKAPFEIFELEAPAFSTTFDVEIWLLNVTKLYSYEFRLIWNYGWLDLQSYSLVDLDDGMGEQHVVDGDDFTPGMQPVFVQVWTHLGDVEGFSGSAKVADLVFHVHQDPVYDDAFYSAIYIVSVEASGPTTNPIPLERKHGLVKLNSVPPALSLTPEDLIIVYAQDKQIKFEVNVEDVVKMKSFSVMLDWCAFDFEEGGEGTAGWTTEEAYSGSTSVKLVCPNSWNDWAGVDIDVDIPLNQITDLSFWKMVTAFGASGWNPNIILAVDADGDGDFDGDLPGFHWGTGVLSDGFVEGEFPVGLGAIDTDFTLVDCLTQMAFWGADTSGVVGPAYAVGNFPAWQTGSYGNIDPTDRVKLIKIVLGTGSPSWQDETAYVDDVTINGMTYPLEPWIKLDPQKHPVVVTDFLPGPYSEYYVTIDDTAVYIDVVRDCEKPPINGTGVIAEITLTALTPWGYKTTSIPEECYEKTRKVVPPYTYIDEICGELIHMWMPDEVHCDIRASLVIDVIRCWQEYEPAPYYPYYHYDPNQDCRSAPYMGFYQLNETFSMGAKWHEEVIWQDLGSLTTLYDFRPIAGDFDMSGHVGLEDLMALAEWYGYDDTFAYWDCIDDFDIVGGTVRPESDGEIDIFDLTVVAKQFCENVPFHWLWEEPYLDP